MLTQERLKELLQYDPETGVFTRLIPTQRTRAGDVVGRSRADGYVDIKVDGKHYLAHRLAYLYMAGAWPSDEVDHKDLDRANNQWSNLRAATRSQNMANRAAWGVSGLKGVQFHPKTGKYKAQTKINGKDLYIGLFPTAEGAHAAYVRAANDNFGEFARAS